ncbi:hypothetical protein HK104_008533 [Borealophlyctis nickersoniae]|nr:hypothetical protein HK104_008533 [Borealophlyctis nickersoniae]
MPRNRASSSPSTAAPSSSSSASATAFAALSDVFWPDSAQMPANIVRSAASSVSSRVASVVRDFNAQMGAMEGDGVTLRSAVSAGHSGGARQRPRASWYNDRSSDEEREHAAAVGGRDNTSHQRQTHQQQQHGQPAPRRRRDMSGADLMTLVSQTVISTAVTCAVLLKQSPIPHALSQAFDSIVEIVRSLDDAYDVRDKAVRLLQSLFAVVVYLLGVIVTAGCRAVVAYRRTPAYQWPAPAAPVPEASHPAPLQTTPLRSIAAPLHAAFIASVSPSTPSRSTTPTPPVTPPSTSPLRRITSLIDLRSRSPSPSPTTLPPSQPTALATETVKLCVGGHNFVTTLATLRSDPESKLAKLGKEGCEVAVMDGDGSWFVDRDGVDTVSNITDPSTLRDLATESDFYHLWKLKSLVLDRLVAVHNQCGGAGHPLPTPSAAAGSVAGLQQTQQHQPAPAAAEDGWGKYLPGTIRSYL